MAESNSSLASYLDQTVETATPLDTTDESSATGTKDSPCEDGQISERPVRKRPGRSMSGRGLPPGIAERTGDGAIDEADSDDADSSDDFGSQVETLLDRVDSLVGTDDAQFSPRRPSSLRETGLTAEEVEKLILKLLSSRGSATGRTVSEHLSLPFVIIDQLLKRLRAEMLVGLKGAAEAGDYEFILTESGRQLAAEYSRECSYFGAAPVCLRDYLKAMAAQSVAKQEVTRDDLQRAFSDLIISMDMLDRLGPAINSGRGMFLFGEPGNGKTSVAERVTSAFGSTIWIPKALGIDGEIVRIYDPGLHEAVETRSSDSLMDESNTDKRWIEVERPTVIVGGELTMDDLEVSQNAATRICEGPIQLKSNCGTLVIDDFGRQRMPVDELLNRWIVPLEKRYDFLNLPSGKKIQVPFDQLIIFSTNLEPKDLVDGAFLRRIPYKIKVPDPTEAEFKEIFDRMSPHMGFQYEEEAIKYLVEKHFSEAGRPFRSCLPRDLLLQVRNYCTYHSLPRKMSPEAFDFAVENYFSIL